MISFRVVAAAIGLSLGLMACVNTDRNGANLPGRSPGADNDPSSMYQPDPNWRAPGVSPPANVTGNTGSGNATASCSEFEGAQGISPNRRLCP